MPLKFPMTVTKLFDLLDVPEIFYEERIDSIYLNKMTENFNSPDNLKPADAFGLIHLSNKYFVYMNYLCSACLKDERFKSEEGRSSLLHGFFSILYTIWDYDFCNSNIGIDSGIERFKKYFSNEIYEELSENEQFIKVWISKKLEFNRVEKMLNMLRTPYDDNFDSISELDTQVIKLIRDAMIYGPIYSFEFYDPEHRNMLSFNLIMILAIHYGIISFDKINEAVDEFFKYAHEPYTSFTKELIEKYNNIDFVTGHFINAKHAKIIKDYLEEHFPDEESKKKILPENPIKFTKESNIF